MTRKRSVVASGAITFILRAVLSALGFAGAVVIARLLGPAGRGLYSVVLVAASVLIAIAKLGLEQTNVFLVGSRGIALERLAGQNLVVAVLLGTPIGFLLLAAPTALPAVFGDVAPPLLLMGALMVPVSLHTQLTAGLQNLSGEVTWQFKAAVLAGVAQLGVLFALAALNSITLTTALAASLFGFVLLWWLTLMRSGAGYLKVRWDSRLMRETLARTLVLHLAMLLLFLHLRVDMLMVKGISGAYALGQYSLAVVLAETVLLGPDSLSIALLPQQTRNPRGACQLRDRSCPRARLGCRWARRNWSLLWVGLPPRLRASPCSSSRDGFLRDSASVRCADTARRYAWTDGSHLRSNANPQHHFEYCVDP